MLIQRIPRKDVIDAGMLPKSMEENLDVQNVVWFTIET